MFTAGVGENDVRMRAKVLEGLEGLNICLDPALNADPRGRGPLVSTPDSRVAVLVVPTNEELEIARESLRLVGD